MGVLKGLFVSSFFYLSVMEYDSLSIIDILYIRFSSLLFTILDLSSDIKV